TGVSLPNMAPEAMRNSSAYPICPAAPVTVTVTGVFAGDMLDFLQIPGTGVGGLSGHTDGTAPRQPIAARAVAGHRRVVITPTFALRTLPPGRQPRRGRLVDQPHRAPPSTGSGCGN